MKKRRSLMMLLCICILVSQAVVINRAGASTPQVSIRLPDGAKNLYYVGETIRLSIHFNEKVNMSEGYIAAGTDGNAMPIRFELQGADTGVYKQDYEATLLVSNTFPTGKLTLGNLQGTAYTSDGSIYYDSSLHTADYHTSIQDLSLDTVELEWDTRVFVNGQEVDAGSTDVVAKEADEITIQLFTMNIGATASVDYFGEQSILLNGDSPYGEWATYKRAIPAETQTRNGIALRRYTYEFTYTVSKDQRMAPLGAEMLVRNFNFKHNGASYSMWLPDEVKEHIQNLGILVDSQYHMIAAEPQVDEVAKGLDREVQITVTDPAGLDTSGDAVFYKWALVGSGNDHAADISKEMPDSLTVPVTEADVAESGLYHLYIRAVDAAGNETVERFGSYLFDVDGSAIETNYPSGTRFGAADASITVTTEATVTSVTYQWQGITAGHLPALDQGGGVWAIGNIPLGPNVYELDLEAEDAFHNTTSETFTFVRDLSAPVVTADVYGPDAGLPKPKHEVEVTIQAAEGDVTASGDSYTVYQLWSDDAAMPDTAHSGWSMLSVSPDFHATAVSPEGADGLKYLFIKAVDAVGNETIVKAGEGWWLDNQPPELQYPLTACDAPFSRNVSVPCDTATEDSTKRNALTIDLVVDGKSGEDLAEYEIEYYASSSPVLAYKNRYPVNSWKNAIDGQVKIGTDEGDYYNGVYYIVFKITDPAGNAHMFMSNGYTLDTFMPTGNIGFVNDVINMQSVPLYLHASEDAEKFSYSFDGVQYSDFTPFTNDSIVYVDLPVHPDSGQVEEGTYTIHVKFMDEVGNVSGTIYTDQMIYDITPPVVDWVEWDPEGWTSGNKTATVFYSDETSPDSGTITRFFDQNGVMDIVITDDAGNQTIETLTLDQIDRDAPQIRFSEWGNLTPQQTAQTIVYVEDEGSGLDESTLRAVWLQEDELPLVGSIDWQPVLSGEQLELSDVSGTWYLYVKAADLTGNETVVRSDAFLLDNLAPGAYVKYSFEWDAQQGLATTTGPITAQVKANYDTIIGEDYSFDNHFTVTNIVKVMGAGGEEPLYGGIGCPDYTEGEGCPDTLVFTENTDQIYRFYIEDDAGNDAAVDTKPIDVIDPSVIPDAEITFTPSTYTNDEVEATVKVPATSDVSYRLVNFAALSRVDYTQVALTRVVTQDEEGRQKTWEGSELETVADWSTYRVIEIAYRFTEDASYNQDDFQIDYEVERCDQDDHCDVRAFSQSFNALDREPPIANLVYSLPELSEENISKYPDFYTNRNVTVRIMPEDNTGKVFVTSPGGAVHTFTHNGSHTFVLQDEAGNVTEKTVTIDRIQKDATEPIVTYSNSSWTNQPVTAQIDFDYDGTGRKVKLDGTNEFVSMAQYVFEDNGVKVISYEDQAGNPGTITLAVDWIDKVAPTGTVTLSTSDASWEGEWTRDDVIATLHVEDNSGEVTMVTDATGKLLPGGETYTFTENGTHTFYFKDPAGNMGSVVAVVNRIDKVAPELTVRYSNERWMDQDGDGTLELVMLPTNAAIRATLEANEKVTVINNGGSLNYDFTENHMPFTFEVVDRAGNESQIEAVVTSLDTTAPIVSLQYSPAGPDVTKEDVVVTITADEPIHVLNNGYKDQYVFEENGEFTFIVEDYAGNVVETTATVDWIDKSKVDYTLSYSETNPTRNDVVVEVITEPAGQLTKLDGSPLEPVTFTRNGVQWMQAKDVLGNEYLIEMSVTNIDKEAPQLSYTEPLLVALGYEVDPMTGVIATDNIDGDLTEHIHIVSNTTNVNLAGTYEIVYEVSDSVGNRTTVARQVKVIPNHELSVYINGMHADDISVIKVSELLIQIFGTQGEWEAYWSKGKRLLGEFKEQGQPLVNGSIDVDQQGFYTIFIRDQEQQAKLIHVYVIPDLKDE